jgi:hypothetical protein
MVQDDLSHKDVEATLDRANDQATRGTQVFKEQEEVADLQFPVRERDNISQRIPDLHSDVWTY